jgi:putative ABC transport system permease protein
MSSKSIRVVLFKLSLAWRNLSQRRSQFLTALAAISFAVFLMFSQIGFQNAMLDSNVAFLRAFNADFVMVNKRRYVSLIEETFDRSRLYQARGFEGVDAAYPLYITMGSWRTYGSRNERPIRVFGFRPDHPVFRSPEIQAQQWALTKPNTVLSDRKSRKEYGALQHGGTGELSNVKVNIVGTFEMGADFVTDGNLIMSDQSFLKIFAVQPSGFEAKLRPSLQAVDMGLLKVAAGTDRDRLESVLNQSLPPDVVVYTQPHFLAKELTYWTQASGLGAIFGLGTIIGFLVGIVVVYNIIYTNIADNLPQYGTLRAIGHSTVYLFNIVLLQSIILAVLGFFPGFCLSTLFYQMISSATGLICQMTPGTVSLVLGLTLFMCIVSGLFAARKLQGLDPADVYSQNF